MTENLTSETFERSVETLISDSFSLLFLAQEEEDNDTAQMFARNSVVSSSLLLEAVANLLLDSLKLSSASFSDYDRLPTLAKYDFYLRGRNLNPLDHGVVQVQRVKEIKTLRDRIVHPKGRKFEWTRNDDYTEDNESMSGILDVTKVLKIPYEYKGFYFKPALIVAQAVHGFLNYFLINLCSYTPDQCHSLIYSNERNPTISDPSGVRSDFMDWFDTLVDLGIKVDHFSCVDA